MVLLALGKVLLPEVLLLNWTVSCLDGQTTVDFHAMTSVESKYGESMGNIQISNKHHWISSDSSRKEILVDRGIYI